MKSFLIVILLSLFALAPLAQAQPQPVPRENILEIIRFIHRWHFDRMSVVGQPQDDFMVDVYVRELQPELDEGDLSLFAELWLSDIKMRVSLKKAHYRIDELDLDLLSPEFKVRSVELMPESPVPLEEYELVELPIFTVRQYLRSTLRLNEYPGEPLIDRMRELLLEEIHDYEELAERFKDVPGQEQVFYIAPVSPVSNQVWVFWENGNVALGLDADFPLERLDSLDFVASRLHIIWLDEDVEFVPDSGRVLNPIYSKDWVGRMLVNCLVFGHRVQVDRNEMELFKALDAE